ncbi:indolepyruvate ferredoxin oxidoreductase family protein [Methylobacterium sp. BTF04]|uniref:indolepyruvate ferredoxin oxidoreductase family protein n=1 Tax=Methylobacterium sp. BTF04 TaxID=2708300 RepID=UPI0013D83866|nr:indolepyruvate ferredoxin oxidoreductase family protein [Methylobacterium sp. BTF04]NEU11117.1 indolepyruvate ferredoxin oxidoreductase family protein [Methylobacterium sp. BTF04]
MTVGAGGNGASETAPNTRVTSLEQIYNAVDGPTFMTGIQALVRLPLMQRRFDRHAGHDTAGLVSGYRGSPLGAYDQQLWKAKSFLDDHDVVFQPGLNEDLAATALWGAQMHRAYGPTRVEGVFGIWYGKGPGVDRSGDVFRTANVLGTSPLGGVLAVAGDDHAAQSSMYPHQTDGIFRSVMMPVLQPADVGEILSLGMAGIALSRFSGLWVALKTVAEVVESAASFTLPDAHPRFLAPAAMVPGHGLNWDPRITWPGQRAELERRLVEERLPAAIAWAAANGIDRPIIRAASTRLCVVTVGKAHQDLMQALNNLGLTPAAASALGVSVYKVAMSWPLDTGSLLAFAEGCEEILVVEEKAPTVEEQIKHALYHRPAERRPRVTGRTDETGAPLLPTVMEFSAAMVARVLAGRLPDRETGRQLAARVDAAAARNRPENVVPFPQRTPFFCPGCPHNSSTKTPEGSISGGGIGCHVMALSQPSLKTATFSQMGGEGAQWMGAAPFSQTPHIFQNLGDGTYQHSGLLAIRAAVAARTPITFKILFNDAVAMTGGQPAEGAPTPAALARQLAAEGVGDIRLVGDEPATLENAADLGAGTRVHHRDELDAVQRELRTRPGVTAIVYVQTCAAEKRRRRKRKQLVDPDRRLFINPRVCEGCGDCSVQSNCIAVEPLETPFGTKRRINQSSCNKDFSCVKGFCPSFVELEGPILRNPDGDRIAAYETRAVRALTDPAIPALQGVMNVYIAGIGGLGVLTLGALLGTAAHLAGLRATVLDFTGLAQKNGAVVSQVRIAAPDRAIDAVRIGEGDIDLMLATDSLVAVSADGQRKFAPGRTAVVVNTDETPTAAIVTDRDARLPTRRIVDTLVARAGEAHTLRATALSQALFGDPIAANVMLVGYAWQKGLVPMPLSALHGAIAANGTAVSLNTRALAWGRLAATDLAGVEKIAGLAPAAPQSETVAEVVARNAADLVAYQDAAYAGRYRDLAQRARSAARAFGPAGEAFARAVAVQAYRVMAYKDEYEVARLYAEPAFAAALSARFAGQKSLSVWLAPPLLAKRDPATHRPIKRRFGPWIFPALRLLAKGKALRGTPVDPFGRTRERRAERDLRDAYLALVGRLCGELAPHNLEAATALATLPAEIRGFGPVKEAALAAAADRRQMLMDAYDTARPDGAKAA